MDLDKPFRVADALSAGSTRKRLRAKRYATPTRGIRVLRELAKDERVLLDALALAGRADHFLSHTTAARQHGMPLPQELDGDGIHIAAPTAGSRMRRKGITSHRLRAATVMVDGLRVEAPADVFVHLAPSLDHVRLVAMADWLVSHRRGAARLTPEQLWAHCVRRSRSPGIRRAKQAVLDCRVGAESPKETEFRLVLAELGLETAELNASIFGERREFLCRLDGAWPEIRTAWEYDGAQHFTDAKQRSKDLDRLEEPTRLGWRVRRFASQHLTATGRPAIRAFAAEVRARLEASASAPVLQRGFWAPCLDDRALRP